jgi:hypothetical protein
MDYARVLERLNEELLQEILDNVARRIEISLIQSFHNQETPDHKKWPERKYNYDHPMLYDKGQLDASRKVEVLKSAIRVSYDTNYTVYVNKVRQIIPTDVPDEWMKIFEVELDKAFKKVFK